MSMSTLASPWEKRKRTKAQVGCEIQRHLITTNPQNNLQHLETLSLKHQSASSIKCIETLEICTMKIYKLQKYAMNKQKEHIRWQKDAGHGVFCRNAVDKCQLCFHAQPCNGVIDVYWIQALACTQMSVDGVLIHATAEWDDTHPKPNRMNLSFPRQCDWLALSLPSIHHTSRTIRTTRQLPHLFNRRPSGVNYSLILWLCIISTDCQYRLLPTTISSSRRFSWIL